MSTPASRPPELPSSDECAIRALYQQLLDGWNQRSGEAMATPFAEDGDVVGFDGSQMKGRAEIASVLQQIFADHVTPTYAGKSAACAGWVPEQRSCPRSP